MSVLESKDTSANQRQYFVTRISRAYQRRMNLRYMIPNICFEHAALVKDQLSCIISFKPSHACGVACGVAEHVCHHNVGIMSCHKQRMSCRPFTCVMDYVLVLTKDSIAYIVVSGSCTYWCYASEDPHSIDSLSLPARCRSRGWQLQGK